jgi:hypothetical protein
MQPAVRISTARLFLCVAAMLLLSLSTGHASNSTSATLHTADTTITVVANPHAPHLIALCSRPGACWHLIADEPLVDSVKINDSVQPLRWSWNRAASISDAGTIRFSYDAVSTVAVHLRLTSEWRIRGNPSEPGPIEHTIRIRNLSGQNVYVPLQDSLQADFRVPETRTLQSLWVEKGAGGPSAEGIHQQRIDQGYEWTGASSTYAHPPAGEPREMIPYVLVGSAGAGGSGWYLGIEFSGRTRIHLARHQQVLQLIAGLNPEPGPYLTLLPPGGTFETPTVFLGTFHGGPDEAANILHAWVRTALNNPVTLGDPHYPTVVNNSWGSGMAIDADQARRMIRDSADLGFEMFHLDAGWFRGVGDWQPDAAKFPQGLAPIADYAHAHGLKFGLWMDWALAARDPKAARYVGNPGMRDWLTTDPPTGWKPEEVFKGSTMDIGVPAVHAWADRELTRVVNDYHLDMLEHDGYVVAQGCDRRDHPHAAPDPRSLRKYEDSGFWWVDSSNSTDVSYFATRAYYDIYAKLRREHPGLLLEICNDGGRMVDFGSAAHGDYFSISDAYDPLSNRRAFYDSSYVLPPAMLETYVQKWPSKDSATFLYGLRSGMMGWFTLMMDTTSWTTEQHATAKQAIALYKDRLRPLIRDAELFHVSSRPDGIHWDGMEYIDRHGGRCVLFAFHGSSVDEATHRYVLRGLDPAARYRVTFQDKSSRDRNMHGSELMKSGLDVALPNPQTSELVFLEKVGR